MSEVGKSVTENYNIYSQTSLQLELLQKWIAKQKETWDKAQKAAK